MLMLLAIVEALAKRRVIFSVLSPVSEGLSSWFSRSSTTARFSFEFEVTMIVLECGSLVMRTLP